MKTESRYSGKILHELLVLPVLLVGIWESVYGLLQVLGSVRSRHALYALTGHFDNPGPFGGMVALCMAVAGGYLLHHNKKIISWLAAICLLTGLLVLPASMSRAAWLALVVALIPAVLRDDRVRRWLSARRWVLPVLVAASVLLLAGMVALKPESALGRLHIWRIEARALASNPLGAGRGTVLGAYGAAQEAFFREHLGSVSAAVVKVAGCPEYAFNEYLRAGVEYGFPGIAIFMAVIALALHSLVRSGSPLSCGLGAWAVFAFFSYPLSTPMLCGALIYLLVCSAILAPLPPVWKAVPMLVAAAFSFLLWTRGTEYPPFRTLYDTGYGLFQEGRYEEALVPLSEGAAISSDPMFEIISGRCHEALGQVETAAASYVKAHYMVPCRLYPLRRLMLLQLSCGNDAAALQTGRTILSMPVNERHLTMMRLREETIASLDSLIKSGR